MNAGDPFGTLSVQNVKHVGIGKTRETIDKSVLFSFDSLVSKLVFLSSGFGLIFYAPFCTFL